MDEWHLVGSVFDAVRRKVDLDPRAGRFVLTGSARPEGVAAHTGAGRVVTVRMRPMTMPERGVTNPTVQHGPVAYRRPDGIAVIPLALLGP